MVLTCLHKDAVIEKNSLNGWLTVQVLDGAIDFTVKEKTMELEKNQMVSLHPGVEHTIRSRREAVLLLINKTQNESGSSLDETNDYYSRREEADQL